MAKIDYRFPCPSCGASIVGRRGPDEWKKHFTCKRCSRSFSVTFDLPDLEADFLNGRLPPDIVPRQRPVEDGFPSAIFDFGKGRKSGR